MVVLQIGNKRLKVQHKQIRNKEMSDSSGGFYGSGDQYDRSTTLATASSETVDPPQATWYDASGSAAVPDGDSPPEVSSASLNDPGSQESALSNLSTLQTALPSVLTGESSE